MSAKKGLMPKITRIVYHHIGNYFNIYHTYNNHDDIDYDELFIYFRDKNYIPLKIYEEYPKYDDVTEHEYYNNSDDESVYATDYDECNFEWTYDSINPGLTKITIEDVNHIPNIISYMLFKNYTVLVKY